VGVPDHIPPHMAHMQQHILTKQKNNIKFLLATLQSVLWDGHSWQAVGMDKLEDPKKVKLYYRKAMMMCHPDKVKPDDDNFEKVYIANRCFAALNDAFN
jgi:UDP-2,3-diacylglucosamine pyrophosphatase LpxH